MPQSGPPSPPSGAPSPGAGARKPDDKIPLNRRAYPLNLTFSMLLTTVIVALIGVSWVFMLGVMVGRGYNPETKVHELTERVLRGRATDVLEPPQSVLRPEELNFGHALRDKPLHNSTSAGMPAARTPARQTNSAAESSASAQAAPPPIQLASQGAQPVRFDIVYQVAVFRDAEQADKLRERLEGEGVRTAMEKIPAKNGKTMYKVLAVRRGTEEDDRQLLGVLGRLKLGSPLPISKKPVGGAGAR